MKVLQFHFGKDGGAERFFVNLTNSFHERGIEQKFIIRPDRSWRKEIDHCGEIYEFNYRRVSLAQFFLKWKVKQFIRDFEPDAIISWMPRASRLLPKNVKPIKLSRIGDFPLKLSHFANTDVMIANMPGIGDHCRNLGWEKRMEIVSNFPKEVSAVPVSRVSMNTPEDAFVISSAGRFVPRKGMDALIRAAGKLDNAYLWLVGDGEEKDYLVSVAREVGMSERVRFAGWHYEPAHILASSDIFCMPSRHEPLGNVALEAWHLGLPVVCARSEGPSWFMQDGENGLLVDIDDIDGFAKAFTRLRDDPKLCKKVIAGANKSLETEFSKKAITDQYINLINGKIGKRPL